MLNFVTQVKGRHNSLTAMGNSTRADYFNGGTGSRGFW